MSEITEFDIESSVSRIGFVLVLSTKSDENYYYYISAISLRASVVDLVLSVVMETSFGTLRVLEFILRTDHRRLGLDLKSIFTVSKNFSLLSKSISLI